MRSCPIRSCPVSTGESKSRWRGALAGDRYRAHGPPNGDCQPRAGGTGERTHPTCDMTSAPGMATTAGMRRSPRLSRKDARFRHGSRTDGDAPPRPPVIRFNTVPTARRCRQGDAYILRGEKDYFFVICAANNPPTIRRGNRFEDLVASASATERISKYGLAESRWSGDGPGLPVTGLPAGLSGSDLNPTRVPASATLLATRTSFSATLPTSRRSMPRRPCVPTITRSASPVPGAFRGSSPEPACCWIRSDAFLP